jgi:hypothetical protein
MEDNKNGKTNKKFLYCLHFLISRSIFLLTILLFQSDQQEQNNIKVRSHADSKAYWKKPLGRMGYIFKTDITEIEFRGLFKIGPNVEIL